MDEGSAVEEVDIDAPRPGKKLMSREAEVHDLKCPECGAGLRLRDSRYGGFYGCSRYPLCKCTHGAHPNGAPLGTPADKPTKQARMRAHDHFDAIWKRGFVSSRGEAYAWMQKALGLAKDEAHMALFDTPRCEALISAVKKAWPELEPMERKPSQR